MSHKLKLLTNYRDYYDHAFDREGTEFRRMNNEGMDRQLMLDFLHGRGFHIPVYGTVAEVVPRLLREYDESLHTMAIESLIDCQIFYLLRIKDNYCEWNYPDNYPHLEIANLKSPSLL